MKKIILIVIILITAFSCGKEKKVNKKVEKQKVETKDTFVFKIRLEYLKNDHIQLFYLEDLNETKFNKKQSFKKEITGKKGLQEVVFEFPKDKYPEMIRVDFGSNPELSSIKIDEILLYRKNDTITISQKNFKKYFSISRPMMTTEDYYNFKLQKSNNHYDPYMVSRKVLNEELSVL